MKLVVSTLLLVLACASCANAYRLVCYYTSAAFNRQSNGRYIVSDIDANSGCTHFMYSEAYFDPVTFTLTPSDPSLDIDRGNYLLFTDLKTQNANLKTMLTIGGYSDSNTPDNKYSTLVSSPTLIANFVTNVVPFLKRFNFDGLDIDWEFPSTAQDKQGLTNLLQALRNAFQAEGLILSVAVSCSPSAIDAGFNVAEINRLVDFISVLTFDIHGPWFSENADHHSPLFARAWDSVDSVTADRGIQYWIAQGADLEKINMGLPFYGRNFALTTSSNNVPPAPSSGPGTPGQFTAVPGLMAYYEVCVKTAVNQTWAVVLDNTGAMGPYAHGEGNWVGYDDVNTAVKNVDYVLSNKLGGAIVFDLSLDDFRNTCGGGAMPLLSAVSKALNTKKPIKGL